ncbi:MAG: pilus assembly protein [Chloroflexi bacterium]|nr:pilus assembly protein [Chloroflexota bacterium]
MRSRGQSIVEFALVSPVLLAMIFGVLDLGRYAYVQAVLDNAVRDGARYGILNPLYPSSTERANPNNVKAKVVQSASVLGITATNVRVRCATSASDFATIAACDSTNTAIGDQVIVTIVQDDSVVNAVEGYIFRTLVSHVVGGGIPGAQFTLKAKAAMIIT